MSVPLVAFACWIYFFFAAFFATFLAAFFVAILPVLPVIKRMSCDVLIAANGRYSFREKQCQEKSMVKRIFFGA